MPVERDRKAFGMIRRGALPGLWRGVFLLLVLALVFSQAMAQPLNHDEHQFVAAGRLIGKHGWLPYLDFPYHHLPYQAFLNAGLSPPMSAGLLSARTLAALFAGLSAALLYGLILRFFQGQRVLTREVAATGGVLLLLSNPWFRHTSGLAWNHDLPTFLTLLALGFILRSGRRGQPAYGSLLAGGLLAGLATGARLTYGVTILVFAAWLLFFTGPVNLMARSRRALVFGAGATLALLPALVLGLRAAPGFWYGNSVYPRLNTVYRQLMSHEAGMTPISKLIMLGEEILTQPGHWLLFAGFLLVLLLRRREMRGEGSFPGRFPLLAGLALTLLLTAFLPTPTWRQYFYAPIPFLIAALYAGLAARTSVLAGRSLALAGGLLVWGAAFMLPSIANLQILPAPERWVPVQAMRLGQAVNARVPEGEILTLAPLISLEGGLPVPPAFATGSFTWRTSHLLSAERRQLYGVVGREELDAYLAARPLAGILTGFEYRTDGFEPGETGGLETPLEVYARRHGFTRIPLDTPLAEGGVSLWVREQSAD